MACQIKRNADGTIAQVLAPNGKDSILYRDIVNNLSNPQVLTQVKQDPYVSMVLGTEYVKGTDASEVGLAAWSKAYSADFINQFGNWKTQTIANTDVNGEPSVDALFPSTQITSTGPATFDKQLAQKIQAKLQALYPEIKLNITNNPVWEKGDNILNQEQFNLEVNYRLKTTKVVLNNYNKIRQWESNKSIDQDILYKKIGELGISNQQLELLKESEGSTVEEKLASFTANYSYTVEINTAKKQDETKTQDNIFTIGDNRYELKYKSETGNKYFKNNQEISEDEFIKANNEYINSSPTQYYSNLTVPGGTNYTENEIVTPAITPSIKGHAQFSTDKGIGWFRSDVKTDDTFTGETYIDEEYGFDDNDGGQPITKEVEKKITKERTPTKTRRILEVQSDLFQKGRNKEQLIGIDFDLQGAGYTFGSRNQYKIIDEYNDEIVFKDTETGDMYKKPKEWLKEQNKKVQVKKSENQFLQLLNKNNNWVNFFVKAIIQDSAEKGYEKVLFPTGNTASKVEGHTTLETFKKQKEDRIKELETSSILKNKTVDGFYYIQRYLEDENGNEVLTWRKVSNETGREKTATIEEINQLKERFSDETKNEINQLKQELERVEKEGFGALKPIYNFYETTLANVLKKQGYNPILITDEYGNTWNEVNINQARDLSEILLQRNKANQIIGQANIKALTVLIDAVNQKQDTLPHEYAHHYISWYRNTPIVQEAIKKWGSEEALVQAIGEQVVKQKGEAYNWWKNFVRWILNQFNKLSTLQKEELAKILTDAFLTRQDLNIQLNTTQPAVKEGVDFVFEQNPELSNIGTQEQYSEYLDTIFPDSKVKDIVYRGIEKKEDTDLFQYWTNNEVEAYMYAKANITKGGNITERNPIPSIYKILKESFDKKYGSRVIDSVLLDESNYIDINENGEAYVKLPEWYDKSAVYKLSDQDKKLIKNFKKLRELYDYVKIESESDLAKQYDDTNYINNIDEYKKLRAWFNENLGEKEIRENIGKILTAIINIKNPYIEEITQEDLQNNRDAYKNKHDGAFLMDGSHFLIKANTEQVHILGTPQDIEGFKRFVSKPTAPISDEWTNVKNNCPKLI